MNTVSVPQLILNCIIEPDFPQLSAQPGNSWPVERESWRERRVAASRQRIQKIQRAPGLPRSSRCVSRMAGAPQQSEARERPGRSIDHLQVSRIVILSQRIFRYLRLLGRFRALTLLRLDYPALSDQTLNALTNAAPKVLKTLHISVRDSDSRHHTIADTAWHNLVLVCPELTVSYTIGTI